MIKGCNNEALSGGEEDEEEKRRRNNSHKQCIFKNFPVNFKQFPGLENSFSNVKTFPGIS